MPEYSTPQRSPGRSGGCVNVRAGTTSPEIGSPDSRGVVPPVRALRRAGADARGRLRRPGVRLRDHLHRSRPRPGGGGRRRPTRTSRATTRCRRALRFDWAQPLRHRVAGSSRSDADPGELIGRALDAGFEAEAVEPNAACADWVRRRYGIAVEEALIEAPRCRPSGFDLIYHVDLLSHFPDPIRALRGHGRLPRARRRHVLRGRSVRRARSPLVPVGRPAPVPGAPVVLRPSGASSRCSNGRGSSSSRSSRSPSLRPRSSARCCAGCSRTSSRRCPPRRRRRLRRRPAGPRGTAMQRAYARVHHLLRYRLGAVVALPGARARRSSRLDRSRGGRDEPRDEQRRRRRADDAAGGARSSSPTSCRGGCRTSTS